MLRQIFVCSEKTAHYREIPLGRAAVVGETRLILMASANDNIHIIVYCQHPGYDFI